MKPKGFVAAASIDSQTLTPSEFANTASSLTRAILTWRKVFSRSFAISASLGELTGTVVSTSEP